MKFKYQDEGDETPDTPEDEGGDEPTPDTPEDEGGSEDE